MSDTNILPTEILLHIDSYIRDLKDRLNWVIFLKKSNEWCVLNYIYHWGLSKGFFVKKRLEQTHCCLCGKKKARMRVYPKGYLLCMPCGSDTQELSYRYISSSKHSCGTESLKKKLSVARVTKNIKSNSKELYITVNNSVMKISKELLFIDPFNLAELDTEERRKIGIIYSNILTQLYRRKH